MLFKIAALSLLANLACAGMVEERGNNLVVSTIVTCTTKLGTSTVPKVPTSTSKSTKSTIKTYTATFTYTPSVTVTPKYESTIDYNRTTTLTSTITSTSYPVTSTVFPASTQLPIGADLVADKRDLAALAAVNLDLIRARQLVTSSSVLYVASSSTPPSTTATEESIVIIVNGDASPPMLPESVGCSASIHGSTTVTVTKTAKKATTFTALPAPTGTTSYLAYTITSSVSTTVTLVEPTPTYYAACNASALYLVSEVAGQPVEAFANVGGVNVKTSDATPYACCASCQQIPTCLFSFFDENSATCTYTTGSSEEPIAWYVGNYTSTYDSLVLANGPAANLEYCGEVPGCHLHNGVEICG